MAETEKPRRNWLLIGSLALNLLVIGAIVGVAIRGGPPDRHRRGPDNGLPAIARALPSEYRDDLRDKLRETWTKSDRRQERDAIRAAFISAVQADEFDGDAVRALIQRQRDLASGMSENMADILVGVLASMSKEDRAEFAENLQHPRKKKKKN